MLSQDTGWCITFWHGHVRRCKNDNYIREQTTALLASCHESKLANCMLQNILSQFLLCQLQRAWGSFARQLAAYTILAMGKNLIENIDFFNNG